MERLFKHVIKRSIALALAFSMIVSVAATGVSFTDTEEHWASDYIEWGYEMGILNGYEDGTFRPDESVTRAEFATMVNLAWQLEGEAEIDFSDVDTDDWYYNTLEKAAYVKSISGYDDGTARPNNDITREEVMTVLSRITPLTPATEETLNAIFAFDDSASVSDWAFSPVARVYGAGYVVGFDDNTIRPVDSITRAEAIAVVARVIADVEFVRDDVTISEDDVYSSNIIYTGTVEISKSIEDLEFENCVFLGPIELYASNEDEITFTNCTITELDYQSTSSSSGGSSGGGSSSSSSSTSTLTLADPSISLMKDTDDTYFITGSTSSIDDYACDVEYDVTYKVVVPAVDDVADADIADDTDDDADEVTVTDDIYKVVLDDETVEALLADETATIEVSAQATSASSSSSSKKYTASGTATATFTAADMVDDDTDADDADAVVNSVTASYVAASTTTSVAWTLDSATADKEKSFVVTIYSVADGVLSEVATATTVEGVYTATFEAELADGTYKAAVSTVGDVDAIAVLSDEFVVTTTVVGEYPLTAPKLEVNLNDSDDTILRIINNETGDCEATCVGDYLVTITDATGAVVDTWDEYEVTRDTTTTGATNTTKVTITDAVATVGEYTITVVLQTSDTMPEAHVHSDAEAVSVSVIRIGDVDDVSIDALTNDDGENVVEVSFAAGEFDDYAETFDIRILETDDSKATENEATITVAKADLTYDENADRYTYDATADIIEMSATLPDGVAADDIRQFTAWVQAFAGDREMTDDPYVLDSATAVQAVTESVYHGTANVKIAEVATALAFDYATDGKVSATWTNPTDDPTDDPTADAGYTLYVYADGAQTGDAITVLAGEATADITAYIDETVTTTYTFGLVTNGYVWNDVGGSVLVLKSAEAIVEDAITSGAVEAAVVTFDVPTGSDIDYVVYFTEAAAAGTSDDLPEYVGGYTGTITVTYNGLTNTYDFDVDTTSIDMTTLMSGEYQFMVNANDAYLDATYAVEVTAQPANTALNVAAEAASATDDFALTALDGEQLNAEIATVDGTTTLTWTNVTGASEYDVTITLDGVSKYTGDNLIGNSLDITEYLVVAGGTYTVVVSAQPITGSTVYKSGTDTLETTVLATPEVEISTEDDTATATWDEKDGAVSYLVEVFYGDETTALSSETIEVTETSTTSLDISDILKDDATTGTYTVEVTAIGDGSAYITSYVGEAEADFTKLNVVSTVTVDETTTDGTINVAFYDSNDEDYIADYEITFTAEDGTAVIFTASTMNTTTINALGVVIGDVDFDLTASSTTGETTLGEFLATYQETAGEFDTITVTVNPIGSLSLYSFTAGDSTGSDSFLAGLIDTTAVTVGATITQETTADPFVLTYDLGTVNEALLGEIASISLTLTTVSEAGTFTSTPVVIATPAISGEFVIPVANAATLAADIDNDIESTITITAVNGMTVEVGDAIVFADTDAPQYAVEEVDMPILTLSDDGTSVSWEIPEGAASYTVSVADYAYSDVVSAVGIVEDNGTATLTFHDDLIGYMDENRGTAYVLTVVVNETTKSSYVAGEEATLTISKLADTSATAITSDEENDTVYVSWTAADETGVAYYSVIMSKDDGSDETTFTYEVVATDAGTYTYDVSGDITADEVADYTVTVQAIGTREVIEANAKTAVYADADVIDTTDTVVSGTVAGVTVASSITNNTDGDMTLLVSFDDEADLSNIASFDLTLYSKTTGNAMTSAITKTIADVDPATAYTLNITNALLADYNGTIGNGTYEAKVTVNSTNTALNANNETLATTGAEVEYTVTDLPTLENLSIDPATTTLTWDALYSADYSNSTITYNVKVDKLDGSTWSLVSEGTTEAAEYEIPDFVAGIEYAATITTSSNKTALYTASTTVEQFYMLEAVKDLVFAADGTLSYTNPNTEITTACKETMTPTAIDTEATQTYSATVVVSAVSTDEVTYINSAETTVDELTYAGEVVTSGYVIDTNEITWPAEITYADDTYSIEIGIEATSDFAEIDLDGSSVILTYSGADGTSYSSQSQALTLDEGVLTATFASVEENIGYTVDMSLAAATSTFNAAVTVDSDTDVATYGVAPANVDSLTVEADGTLTINPQDGVVYTLTYIDANSVTQTYYFSAATVNLYNALVSFVSDDLTTDTITLDLNTLTNLPVGADVEITFSADASGNAYLTNNETTFTIHKLVAPSAIAFQQAGTVKLTDDNATGSASYVLTFDGTEYTSNAVNGIVVEFDTTGKLTQHTASAYIVGAGTDADSEIIYLTSESYVAGAISYEGTYTYTYTGSVPAFTDIGDITLVDGVYYLEATLDTSNEEAFTNLGASFVSASLATGTTSITATVDSFNRNTGTVTFSFSNNVIADTDYTLTLKASPRNAAFNSESVAVFEEVSYSANAVKIVAEIDSETGYLTWEADDAITSYTVKIGDDTAMSSTFAVNSAAYEDGTYSVDLFDTFTALSAGVTYTVTVAAATYDEGTAVTASELSFHKLSAPSDIAFADDADIVITDGANTTGVASYELYVDDAEEAVTVEETSYDPEFATDGEPASHTASAIAIGDASGDVIYINSASTGDIDLEKYTGALPSVTVEPTAITAYGDDRVFTFTVDATSDTFDQIASIEVTLAPTTSILSKVNATDIVLDETTGEVTVTLTSTEITTNELYAVTITLTPENDAFNAGVICECEESISYDENSMELNAAIASETGILTWTVSDDTTYVVKYSTDANYTSSSTKTVTGGEAALYGEDSDFAFEAGTTYYITLTATPAANSGLAETTAEFVVSKLTAPTEIGFKQTAEVKIIEANTAGVASYVLTFDGEEIESDIANGINAGVSNTGELTQHTASAYVVAVTDNESIVYVDSDEYDAGTIVNVNGNYTYSYTGALPEFESIGDITLVDNVYYLTATLDPENPVYQLLGKEYVSAVLVSESGTTITATKESFDRAGTTGEVVFSFGNEITPDTVYTLTLATLPRDADFNSTTETVFENVSYSDEKVTIAASINKDGILTWDADEAITTYTVTIDNGSPMTVTYETDGSYEIDLFDTFELSDGVTYTVTVTAATYDEGTAVTASELSFHKLSAPSDIAFDANAKVIYTATTTIENVTYDVVLTPEFNADEVQSYDATAMAEAFVGEDDDVNYLNSDVTSVEGLVITNVTDEAVYTGSLPEIIVADDAALKLDAEGNYYVEFELEDIATVAQMGEITVTLIDGDNSATATVTEADGTYTATFKYAVEAGTAYTVDFATSALFENFNTATTATAEVSYTPGDGTLNAEVNTNGVLTFEVYEGVTYTVAIKAADETIVTSTETSSNNDLFDTFANLEAGTTYDVTVSAEVPTGVDLAIEAETVQVHKLLAPSAIVFKQAATVKITDDNVAGSTAYVLTFDDVEYDESTTNNPVTVDSDLFDIAGELTAHTASAYIVGATDEKSGIVYLNSDEYDAETISYTASNYTYTYTGALPEFTDITGITLENGVYSVTATLDTDSVVFDLLGKSYVSAQLVSGNTTIVGTATDFDRNTGIVTFTFENVVTDTEYTITLTTLPRNGYFNTATETTDTVSYSDEEVTISASIDAEGNLTWKADDAIASYIVSIGDGDMTSTFAVNSEAYKDGTYSVDLFDTFTALSAGATYTVTVAAATYDEGTAVTASELSFHKLSAPATATIIAGDEVATAWGTVSSAKEYSYVLTTDGTPGTAETFTDTSTTIATVAGSTYSFAVSATGYDDGDIYYFTSEATISDEVEAVKLAVGDITITGADADDDAAYTATFAVLEGAKDYTVTVSVDGATPVTISADAITAGDTTVTVALGSTYFASPATITVAVVANPASALYTTSEAASEDYVVTATTIDFLVTATESEDGDVVLTWDMVEGATQYSAVIASTNNGDITLGVTTQGGIATATIDRDYLTTTAARVTVTAKSDDPLLDDGVMYLYVRKTVKPTVSTSDTDLSFSITEVAFATGYSATLYIDGVEYTGEVTVADNRTVDISAIVETEGEGVYYLVVTAVGTGSVEGVDVDVLTESSILFVESNSSSSGDITVTELEVDLSAIEVDEDKYTVTFPVVANATSYKVTATTVGETESEIKDVEIGDEYVVITLTDDYFKTPGDITIAVTAYSTNPFYVASEETTATYTVVATPIEIDGLVATEDDDGNVVLTWEVADGATSYTVTLAGTEYQTVSTNGGEATATATIKSDDIEADTKKLVTVTASSGDAMLDDGTQYVIVKRVAAPEVTSNNALIFTIADTKNATGYVATLDGEEVDIDDDLTVDITDIVNDTAGTYTLSAIALGNSSVEGTSEKADAGTIYTTSIASEASFTVEQLEVNKSSIEFDDTDYTISFDKVENADSYTISVTTTGGTTWTAEDYEVSGSTVTVTLDSTFFASVGDLGIKIIASSNDPLYATSDEVIDIHSITATNYQVSGLSITEADNILTLTWDETEGATSYTVSLDGTEYTSTQITEMDIPTSYLTAGDDIELEVAASSTSPLYTYTAATQTIHKFAAPTLNVITFDEDGLNVELTNETNAKSTVSIYVNGSKVYGGTTVKASVEVEAEKLSYPADCYYTVQAVVLDDYTGDTIYISSDVATSDTVSTVVLDIGAVTLTCDDTNGTTATFAAIDGLEASDYTVTIESTYS